MVYTFDDILLMYMGKTAYQGTLDDALRSMASIGLCCGNMQNPSDAFLDILSDEPSAELLANTQRQLTEGNSAPGNTANIAVPDRPETRKWKTGFSRQYKTLLRRSFRQTWRYILHPLQLAEFSLITLMIGCIYFQLPRTEEMLRSRDGGIAQLVVLNGFRALTITFELYPPQLQMLKKERFVRLYQLSPYFLANLTTDMLLWGTLPLLQMTIVYWMAGLWADAVTFLGFLLIYLLQNLATQSITMLGVILLGTHRGVAFGTTVVNFFAVTVGFFTVGSRFWSNGMKYISLFYYVYGGMIGLEIGRGPNITCRSYNISRVPTCHNIGVTTFEGTYHVQSLGLIQPEWVNVLAVLTVFIICRAAAYVSLRYLRRPQLAQ